MALAVKFGVPPSEILQWSETDFVYALALMKIERDEVERERTR